jgi:hypothetical protein
MSIRKLFIKDDEETTEKPKVSQTKPVAPTPNQGVKFPSSPDTTTQGFDFKAQPVQTPSFSITPTMPINTGGVPQEYIDNALSIYQQGFDSLNQPGFDFYEFQQLVINGGVTNPQVYSMAFSMSNGMDKTVTKERLVQGADYYINEIINQYNGFVSQGNSKKQSIEVEKSNENQSLLNDMETIKQQMDSLKIQLEDRQRKLNEIGVKYDPQIIEIDNKLAANNIAKDRIISSIEQVKQGIINNLK